MIIRGHGQYEDSLGGRHDIQGIADLPDTGVRSIDVSGNISFDTMIVERGETQGITHGKLFKGGFISLQGKASVDNIEAEVIRLSGNIISKKIIARTAKIFSGNECSVDEINVKDTLTIKSTSSDAKIDLKLDLPFLKLNLQTSNKSGDGFSFFAKKINVTTAYLQNCTVDELACENGRLQKCVVGTLIAKGDIIIDGDCIIKNIIKANKELPG